MFSKIEECFKIKSQRKKNNFVALIILLVYITIAILLWDLIEKNFLLILIPISTLILLCYLYIVYKNIRFHIYERKRWYYILKVIYSIEQFKQKHREIDKIALISILKDNGINTRHKVGNILEHYRIIIPRNINQKITIISFLSLAISIFVFLYESSNSEIFYNKLSSLLIVILLVFFGFWVFGTITKELSIRFGKKSLYIIIEDLLTEIYVKCDIK